LAAYSIYLQLFSIAGGSFSIHNTKDMPLATHQVTNFIIQILAFLAYGGRFIAMTLN
jgi:hypothetical protein